MIMMNSCEEKRKAYSKKENQDLYHLGEEYVVVLKKLSNKKEPYINTI